MVSHVDCNHPNTKAGRAACRKVAAGGEAPRPRAPRAEAKPTTAPVVESTPEPAAEEPKRRFFGRR
jgi:hypothetical protein